MSSSLELHALGAALAVSHDFIASASGRRGVAMSPLLSRSLELRAPAIAVSVHTGKALHKRFTVLHCG
jgi:hypothetical protein